LSQLTGMHNTIVFCATLCHGQPVGMDSDFRNFFKEHEFREENYVSHMKCVLSSCTKHSSETSVFPVVTHRILL
jgi:hypothetical protein